jgi:ribosome biogenesis GTPase
MMDEGTEGLIIRSSGGFYDVAAEEGTIIRCRARGLFRKIGLTPLVGDRVTFALTGEEGYIQAVMPRRNNLVRPPLANLDQLILVASVLQPPPNLFILDKLIAIARYRDIETVVVLTKSDLEDPSELAAIYRRALCPVVVVSNRTGEGVEAVKAMLPGRVSAFCGNTGVGKSSLLNRLDPAIGQPTADISHKLGRGRHTTRTVELFSVGGGYVADTPGFSAVETERFDPIRKEELQYCFAEFEPFIARCRFTGCSHTREKGCAVLAAVADGFIAPSRHQSYAAMYEEQKALKEWEIGAERPSP